MSLDIAAPAAGPRPFANAQRLLIEIWHDKSAVLGLAVIVLILVCAVFGPWIAPYDPGAQDIAARLAPPFWMERGSLAHLLGTDHLGRDILSRIIHGSRASLLVAGSVVLLAGTFGTIMGLWAGFRGGRTDSVIMRIVDIQVALPALLLILLVISVVGAGLVPMIVVLSIANWMVYARLVRSIVLSVRQLEYIEAAEMIGCRPTRVVFKHLFPNLISPLLTLAILEFSNIILAEAALSFLGLGVQPPDTSWGLDVANGKDYLYVAWWLVTFPGLCISITVIAINLLANWVRVTTDPQEREKRHARQRAGRRNAMLRKATGGGQQ